LAKQSESFTDNQVETTFNELVLTNRKPFIEPELSAAVDVLEATTFFQGVTSGATN
jgi:hypothetical protein